MQGGKIQVSVTEISKQAASLTDRAPSARTMTLCCLDDSSSTKQKTRAARRLWTIRNSCTGPNGSHRSRTALVRAWKSCASPSVSSTSGLMRVMLGSDGGSGYPQKHDPLVVN